MHLWQLQIQGTAMGTIFANIFYNIVHNLYVKQYFMGNRKRFLEDCEIFSNTDHVIFLLGFNAFKAEQSLGGIVSQRKEEKIKSK